MHIIVLRIGKAIDVLYICICTYIRTFSQTCSALVHLRDIELHHVYSYRARTARKSKAASILSGHQFDTFKVIH